ncbi:MAG: hypothetical protein ACF788_12210 [Novipirellula sp. JB048]
MVSTPESCPSFHNGECRVASKLAGMPVLFDVRACDVCASQPNPRAVNKVTTDIAAHALRQAGKTDQANALLGIPTSRPIGPGVGKTFATMAGWINQDSPNCRCRDFLRIMNQWGPQRCTRERARIAKWWIAHATEQNAKITIEEMEALILKAADQHRSPRQTADDRETTLLARYTSADVTYVTTHFNFARYQRTAKTYYEWLPKLPLEIASRVICYECVLDDDAPEINGSIVVRGTREENCLWQKEALLQIALDQCTTPLFCWIDHDTYHRPEDADWLARATKMLTGKIKAVQLFKEFCHYDEAGNLTQQKRNMFVGGFSPGGVWIAETEYLRSIGGFPRTWITGSGDYHLYESMKANATYLDISAHHIWHGDLVNRRYQERHKAIDDLGFKASEDIGFTATGLAYWRTDKPGLRQAVRDYFAGRHEDG